MDAELLVSVYELALDDLPGWAILAAAKETARTQTFRPAPAELRTAALAEVRHAEEMERLKQKPAAIPEDRRLPAPPPTQAEIEDLNAYLEANGMTTRFNYDGTTYQDRG